MTANDIPFLRPNLPKKCYAGLAAWAGFLLGMYEMDRRNYDRLYHEGAIIFVLMIVCIVSSLIVYDWLASLVQKYVLKSDPSSAQVLHGAVSSSALNSQR